MVRGGVEPPAFIGLNVAASQGFCERARKGKSAVGLDRDRATRASAWANNSGALEVFEGCGQAERLVEN